MVRSFALEACPPSVGAKRRATVMMLLLKCLMTRRRVFGRFGPPYGSFDAFKHQRAFTTAPLHSPPCRPPALAVASFQMLWVGPRVPLACGWRMPFCH